MNVRIGAWWGLCGVMGLALALGEAAVIVLFALFSSLSLREYIGLTKPGLTKPASFWAFLLFTPLQYWLVWTRSHEMFTILIPVCALLYIPAYNALAGGAGQFWSARQRLTGD